MENPIIDNVGTLLAAGNAIGKVIEVPPGAVPSVVVPVGYKLQELAFRARTVRRSVSFTDPASFSTYVGRYKQGGTLIFADVNDRSCSLTACLDYHPDVVLLTGEQETGWWSHQANLSLEATQEWITWMARNGNAKPFSQTDFALFLEDNERVFESPSGADLLELVSTLEGKSAVRFNSAIRLQSGKNRLDFEEDVELRGASVAAQGAIEIPAKLLLLIQPFVGVPHYRVEARLRYRIVSKALTFWYDTVTPHLVVRDAAKAVLAKVGEDTGVPVLLGK